MTSMVHPGVAGLVLCALKTGDPCRSRGTLGSPDSRRYFAGEDTSSSDEGCFLFKRLTDETCWPRGI
eukprot:10417775-Prorocentrum_lima.AAC.1